MNSIQSFLSGGKDSLVVWYLNSKENKVTDLFYVTDDTEDFTKNQRLKEISRLTGNQYHLGKS